MFAYFLLCILLSLVEAASAASSTFVAPLLELVKKIEKGHPQVRTMFTFFCSCCQTFVGAQERYNNIDDIVNINR